MKACHDAAEELRGHFTATAATLSVRQSVRRLRPRMAKCISRKYLAQGVRRAEGPHHHLPKTRPFPSMKFLCGGTESETLAIRADGRGRRGAGGGDAS